LPHYIFVLVLASCDHSPGVAAATKDAAGMGGQPGSAQVCTRLHAIGFGCEMDRATADAVAAIARSKGRRIETRDGEYRTWVSTGGAEIWLHYPSSSERAGEPKPIDDLKGLTVVQRGASSIRMRIHRKISWKPENGLDGVCIANLPALRRKGRGLPFVFEQVGFAVERVPPPFEAHVQVVGLAHRVWAYASEGEFLRALPSRRLVSRGSIAAMEPEEVSDARLIYRTKPGALWLVTGVILKSIQLRNPLADKPYYWLLVETDRGNIDIVVNPAVIEGDISSGHTIQTVVSMVGRILDRIDDA
jgi:hypothetical protein